MEALVEGITAFSQCLDSLEAHIQPADPYFLFASVSLALPDLHLQNVEPDAVSKAWVPQEAETLLSAFAVVLLRLQRGPRFHQEHLGSGALLSPAGSARSVRIQVYLKVLRSHENNGILSCCFIFKLQHILCGILASDLMPARAAVCKLIQLCRS